MFKVLRNSWALFTGLAFMNYYGPSGFFTFIMMTHICTILYGVHRIFVKKGVVSDNSFVAVPRAASPLALELSPEADPMPPENKS